MKECRKCKQTKPLTEFYKATSRTKDNLRHECKTCWNKASLEYYEENKESLVEKRKDYHYRKNYGIELVEFEKMKADAKGRCQSCGKETELVLDHCHSTGKVRGVLCNRCNHALGHALDSVAILKNLIHYLETH